MTNSTAARLNLLRLAGIGLSVALWFFFLKMALHTSRNPVLLSRYSVEYAILLGTILVLAVVFTSLQWPAVYRRMYAVRHTLISIFIVSPLLAGAAIEISLRYFNLLGASFYGEIRRYMTVLAPDENLSFRNPVRHRGIYQGVEIATNEIGLRERPLSPPSNERWRVLVLGDSVAFGWGVRVEDTFSRQLETDLRQELHIRAETVNSGVPGYNTRQGSAFLAQYYENVKPDLILLLYVDNDIDTIDSERTHMGIRPNLWKNPTGVADYYLSWSRLYFMARHLTPVLLSAVTGSFSDPRTAPGWRESMESLAATARFCRERNVPLVVLQFRMVSNALQNALNEDITSLAGKEGFHYCDTLPWFQGRNLRELTNSFIDTHPNANGHRVLAAGALSYLTREGLVPGCGAVTDGNALGRDATRSVCIQAR
jgi:lysophospholipase L1-like esterase